MPTNTISNKNEIDNIQILRAIAALLVVSNHLLGSIYGGIFKFNGGLGVDIFFIISGFLMVYTQKKHRGPIEFIIGRIKRIYPTYILISLPLILSRIQYTDLHVFIGNFLLTPDIGNEQYKLANPPAWSLVYEMIFYVIFTLSLMFSTKKATSFILSSIAIIITLCIFKSYHHAIRFDSWVNIDYILSDFLLINFIAGGVIALIVNKIQLKINFPFFIFIAITLLFISLSLQQDTPRIVKFGIPAFFIVLVACISHAGCGVFYKTLHKIGDASYSLYISHIYIVILAADVYRVNGSSEESKYFISLLMLILSVLLSLFLNKSIEKPIANFFKQRKNQKQL